MPPQGKKPIIRMINCNFFNKKKKWKQWFLSFLLSVLWIHRSYCRNLQIIHRRLKPFSSSSLIYSSISSYYLNLNQNNAYIRHYKDTGIKTHEITWLYLWKKNKSRLSSLFICLLLFKRSFCGLPSEVPSFNSGIIMKAPSTEQLLEQNG